MVEKKDKKSGLIVPPFDLPANEGKPAKQFGTGYTELGGKRHQLVGVKGVNWPLSGADSAATALKAGTQPSLIETALEMPRRKVGRPAGKRSDPNYERLTVLVRKDVRRMAERTWEDRTSSKDMSEMVEWLLIQYLANPGIFETSVGSA